MQFGTNVNRPKTHFTNDQQQAIDGIIEFIAEDFDPSKFIVGLTGAGGTGKTFITNYIINNCKYSPSVIKCCSTTHKACRVLSAAINYKEVNTIQSTFGFRLDLKLEDFDPNRPQFNPNATPKINECVVLIVDEASMLNAGIVTYICKICKEKNIKIIFIGDSNQLAPVNERMSIAFKRCYKVYELNEVVRQASENPINELLNLIRNDIANKTYESFKYINDNKGISNINELGEGIIICGKQEFRDIIDVKFNDEEYEKNIDMYRIIGYTNDCVNSWNNYIRNRIIIDSDKNIITKNDLIMSYETIVNDFLEIVITNSEEYVVNDIVNWCDDAYKFKSFKVRFQMVHGGKITQPLIIIDHRDKYTILKYHQVISNLKKEAQQATGATRVTKWKNYYNFKKKYLLAANVKDRFGKTLYSRDIDYGFAITSHKSQGSTYNTVFVDLNDMIYNTRGQIYADRDDMLRRIYVACSRAKHQLIICTGE